MTLNRLEYTIEKDHFLIRKTKSRKELFSFEISMCTFCTKQRTCQNSENNGINSTVSKYVTQNCYVCLFI